MDYWIDIQEFARQSEIRRAYKLCFDSNVAEEIRIIAKETFLFISLTTSKDTDSEKFKFTTLPAPWEFLEWKAHWKNRVKSTHSSHKSYPWKKELQKLTTKI